MMHPPRDPEMRPPPHFNSLLLAPAKMSSASGMKLQELFNLCRNTALAVASLAFAGGRR